MEIFEGEIGKRRPRNRVSRKLVMGMIAFPCLIACVLVAAFHVPALQSRLIQAYLKQVEADSGLRVHLQSHQWSLFSGLRLMGIRIHASGRELLVCEEARVSLRLSLPRSFIRMEQIHLIRPVLHLEQAHDHQWQLPSGAPGERRPERPGGISAEENGFPWELIPRIRIESGQIIAEQGGRQILSVRDVAGVFVPRLVPGSKGPKIRLELANGGHLPDAFSGWLQRAR